MANEDPDYLAWVRKRACAAVTFGACSGTVSPHHAGERGLGQRSHDHTAIPLCFRHHRAWHDLGLPFKAWPKEERQAWAGLEIQRQRTDFLYAMNPKQELPF